MWQDSLWEPLPADIAEWMGMADPGPAAEAEPGQQSAA